VAGTALTCDDGDACNGVETCDALLGCVAGTALTCDDGDACNGVETCDALLGCVAGAPLECDDGNACTVDSCDPALGCGQTPVDVDDGNALTVDVCDPQTGEITHTDATPAGQCGNPADGTLTAIDDSDACTTDACDAQTGEVTHTALPDADGDGVCDAIDNCVNMANADQADADGNGLGDACESTPSPDTGDDSGDTAPDAQTLLDCCGVCGAGASGAMLFMIAGMVVLKGRMRNRRR
jgi:hypothetical protein